MQKGIKWNYFQLDKTKMKKQVKPIWKTIAIILMAILIILFVIVIWSNASYNKEMKETNICYFDVCEQYPDAEYDYYEKVCYCYDYDMMGDLVLSKTKYMGKR